MNKVLIAYATWAGTTHEVANAIGKFLSENSIDVEIADISSVLDIGSYDAFILGTSIHAGQTMISFRKFIRRNINILKTKPTAIFVVCANMMNDNEENRSETLSWINRAIEKFEGFNPISIGLFAGAALIHNKDFEKLNFILRRIITSMENKMIQEYGKSDFRDWDKIQLWTTDLVKII